MVCQPSRATCIRLVLSLLFVCLFSVAALGQRKTDIGFFTGMSFYQGDLSAVVPVPHLSQPAIGPILRYNFNMRHALRAHAIAFGLSAANENFRQVRAEFQASFVDLGLDFEFNWWPYKTAFRKTKYTPYVSAGLGYALNYTGGSRSHLYLPFGGGFKMNLGLRLSGGLEFSMRKTFTDMIDGQQNLGGERVASMIGNNDWYMFTGLFVTYKIFNFREECPTYD